MRFLYELLFCLTAESLGYLDEGSSHKSKAFVPLTKLSCGMV